ncbi:MAG: hypothetical protein ABIM89_12515 [Mycobacteriales bacterium]
MLRNLDRDDRDFDLVLRGSAPADRPELDPVVALVEDLRFSATAAARPSAALATLLAQGLPPAPVAAPVSHLRRAAPAVSWAAAISWARSARRTVKVGVIAAVAVVSVTSAAAAAGALPDPIQEKLSTAVKTVTPWEIPRPKGGGGIGEIVREKARHHGHDKQKHIDPDKDVDAPKTNNGNGRPSDPGKPASPGKSDASKSDAPRPSQAANPTKPAHPTKPTASAATPGRPAVPGADRRSAAAERQNTRDLGDPAKITKLRKARS